MNDKAWDKVRELTTGRGYSDYFNAAAMYDLVVAAWRMGLDVIPAPLGSTLHEDYCAQIARLSRNVAMGEELQFEAEQVKK